MISGMDTDSVTRLANQMLIVGQRVRALELQLTNELANAAWQGADRERFHAEWESRHRQLLRSAAADLDAAHDLAVDNVREQEKASG